MLIHNAGNVRYGMIADLSIEDFNAVTDVHFSGGFMLAKAAMPHMIAADYGRVVLTASCSGLYGSQTTVNYGMSKAGLMGLNNVIALEGGRMISQSNTIIPAAVTRMADGLDTSAYPPMEPELVAPMVAYLCHESCAVSGEHFIAAAGRMARAWTTESKGIFRPEWSVEDVASEIETIRNSPEQWTFPPYPSGMMDHLGQSFAWAHSEMARLMDEARLQALLDRQDITDCLTRFSRGIDRLDRDLFLSAFHEDALIAAGPFVGNPPELADWSFAMHAEYQLLTQHNWFNHSCELTGNVAHSRNLLSVRRAQPLMKLGDAGWRALCRPLRGPERRLENRAADQCDRMVDNAAQLAAAVWRCAGGSNGVSGRDQARTSYIRPLTNKRPPNRP